MHVRQGVSIGIDDLLLDYIYSSLLYTKQVTLAGLPLLYIHIIAMHS